MKNETAIREIESLDYYLQNHTNDYSEKSHTAMMMAIEALQAEPIKHGTWQYYVKVTTNGRYVANAGLYRLLAGTIVRIAEQI